MRLRDLHLDIFYDAPGAELARSVLLPALGVASRYDRVAAYFNLASLISIGQGLERLRSNDGHMRLLMGVHDVDLEIVSAATYSQLDELMNRLRRKILDGVSSLSNELERNRIEAAAWMMRDGLLEVRCAAPRPSQGAPGIFHNKRLIFTDRFGDVVTATGSVNETGAGLGRNFEELTIHTSWESPDYTTAHSGRFEAVWEGRDARIATTPLGPDFASELLDALSSGVNLGRNGARAQQALDVLTNSPHLGALNSSRAPLYPHQERALVAACSRWPIRALLADEVGLGKTYEAAAVVSFALKHADVSRVVVLAPPTLLRQWQDEFKSSFDLDFWRYDSATRQYFAAGGSTHDAQAGPFQGEYPDLVIVSRDLARGTRRSGHAFQDAEILPDMIVLDEAHAVRKRRSTTEARPSLVGRMVRDLLSQVPHALFLTATPLQTDAAELFDALELLGVPSTFDEASYRRSLQLLAIPPEAVPELDQASSAINMVKTLVDGYKLDSKTLPIEIARTIADISGGASEFALARRAQASWSALQESLVRIHPAATLAIRNTRGTLARVGYDFPERVFRGVECAPTPEVGSFLAKLDEYLTSNLGAVESELYPGRASAVGFVRSIYRQRAASSLRAVQVSLERRLDRLRQIQSREAETGDEFVEEDVLDGYPNLPVSLAESVDYPALDRACAIESLDIELLLEMLDGMSENAVRADPKFDSAIEELRTFRASGRSVLLFSRYSDTVQGLIERFIAENGPDQSYASYTGDGGLIKIGGQERKGDKSLVTEALARGEVDVVFCTDAASEGLNLQSASTLINVDVPWNPARLEQRIGRIARLGQSAPKVDIVNIWYPRSVEARIYERVLQRKDMMELALGAFPEIVGNAIKDAVRGKSIIGIETDVLEQLSEKRSEIELESLTNLWSGLALGETTVGTGRVRERIAKAFEDIAASSDRGSERSPTRGWETPTDDPLLGPLFTLHPDWVGWLADFPMSELAAPFRGRLGILRRGSRALTFALREGQWVKALAPTAIPDVLRALFLGEEPEFREHVFVELQLDASSSHIDVSVRNWWPEPEAVSVPTPGLERSPDLPDWARSDLPFSFVPFQG